MSQPECESIQTKGKYTGRFTEELQINSPWNASTTPTSDSSHRVTLWWCCGDDDDDDYDNETSL